MSRTLIATIVAFAVIAIILAFFDRMLALSIVSVSAASVYLTFLAFVCFGSQFNIAALIGLLIIGLVSIFSGLYYVAKLKDELYKGRTLKKAHTEAAKKAVWPTIDASLIAIIIGVFVYIFAGDLARKMGVVLVMGGFISALMNLAYFPPGQLDALQR
jgi:multidrug efflux pump subunit AcrB